MSSRFPSLALALLASTAMAAPLRVCADPQNLPFSDKALRGFENDVASLLARDLHRSIVYVWTPEARRVVRKTLGASRCELLLGVPSNLPGVLTTSPYYRSTYVFATLKGGPMHVRSFDDAALRRARIGIQIAGDEYTPPGAALGRRGLAANLHGYALSGAGPNSQFHIMEALVRKEIDVAVVWGPVAGAYSKRSPLPVEITALPPQPGPVPMQFAISLGVRNGNDALRRELNAALERERPAIRQMLLRHGVPLV